MARQQKQQQAVAAPAAPREQKRWRIKDGAPPHYVNGQGMKHAGEEFVGGPVAQSTWCVEVVPDAKPARQQQQEKGAASAAPDPDAVVERDPSEDPRLPAGTF